MEESQEKKEESTKALGRPSKISNFINMMQVVFDELENDTAISPNGSTFFFTDVELFEMVNLSLQKEDQIHMSTFQKWKAMSLKGDSVDHPVFEDFLRLIKKAQLKQKRALGHKLVTDDRCWTRWAWILERKFDDMNLKHKAEIEEKRPVTFPNIIIKKAE